MLNSFMAWIRDHQRDDSMGGKYGMTRREFKNLSPYMQDFVQRDSFAGSTTGKPETAISQIERGKDGLPTLGKQKKPQNFTPILGNRNSAGSNSILDMLKSFVMR